MIETDQSDQESQSEMPSLRLFNSSDIAEPTQKRLREVVEDNELEIPSKKICTSIDETISKEQNKESEVNGTAKGTESENEKNKEDNKNEQTKSISDERIKEILEESDAEASELQNNEVSSNGNDAIQKANESITSTDTKEKESVENADKEDTTMKEESEEEEDSIKPKKKHKKSQIENAEVVEGLELSVECASDKESSSPSDNEDEKVKKTIPKTIIVKEKPNDSELDVSSSEAEKSDSEAALEEAKSKKITKRGRKKSKTSFSKQKSTDSEENNDDVSDEDYSPKTKKKLKKAANKSAAKSPTEPKKGRRGRKPKKLIEKEDAEDENSNITEDKKTEEKKAESTKTDEDLSGSESIQSEDQSDSTDGKNKKKPDDDKRIQLLKKYIRIAGIRVKCYNDLWVGCKSNAARVRCLRELLKKHGINGRPSLEKCKEVKARNETLKDIAELSMQNIISEGRVTRAQRNRNKESINTPETPTKQREARNKFKRVLNVVDSESE